MSCGIPFILRTTNRISLNEQPIKYPLTIAVGGHYSFSNQNRELIAEQFLVENPYRIRTVGFGYTEHHGDL